MNLPNRLTVGRLGLCILFVLCLEIEGKWSGFAAFFIFILASLTDWLDGYLARKLNLVTDLGKLLDPLADKVLVSAAYICLVAEDMAPAWVVICIITREFLITGLRTLAAAKGLIMAAEKAGKHKTITQIVAVLVGLLLLALDRSGVTHPKFLTDAVEVLFRPLLYLALVVTVYSGLLYFLKNRNIVTTQ